MYQGNTPAQTDFFENFFLPIEFKKDHPIIRIADAIDWDTLCTNLKQFYCTTNGRPTKPTRAKVGLLLLKHYYQISDDEVVDRLEHDLYFQYLCGLNLQQAQNFMEPSGLTHFRNTLGLPGIHLIETTIQAVLDKSTAKKRGPKPGILSSTRQ